MVIHVTLHQFGDVLLEALDLFFEIVDLLVDDVEGSNVVMPILNFDLNQKFVIFALFREVLSLIKRLKLLSTNFNGSVNIENRVTLALIFGFSNELGNLVLLLHLYIAVEKEGRIIFVVIIQDIIITLHRLRSNSRRLNELLQVLDQVREL